FRAGSPHHYPASFAEIDFDAVEVFASRDVPISHTFRLLIRKMRDSFFFLPPAHVQVNATVVVFAEFRVQAGEQFAEGFSVPCNDPRKEQRGNRRVAFRQIETGADAAALFSANQNILLEHQLADVLEADGYFV